jgi:hypothetical protein
MKAIGLFLALLATAFASPAATNMLEKFSPHLATNTPILWRAPMTNLPESFWIYKKLPRVFPASVISNAIVLASFQDKGFPQPSTNPIVIRAGGFNDEPEPPEFSILPDEGQISFSLGDRRPDSPEDVATNEAAVERAWDCLLLLGIDRSQFLKTNIASSRVFGVCFPRPIDGIEPVQESEGFQIQFGKEGKILEFCLSLPELERDRQSRIASPQEIIACVRAFRTPLLANGDEPDYRGRLENLAHAKTFTITKITPYYNEGGFGGAPTNDEPPKLISFLAELEAVAGFGDSNVTVRLLSPVLSSDVSHLLR